MSLRSYDLESRRAHTFGRSTDPGGTFRRIHDDGKRENIQSLFETANASGGATYGADTEKALDGKALKKEQGEQFHTLPKRDVNWDSYERSSSSTLPLEDAPSSQVVLRSHKKSRSDASDKTKRHSGGLFGYLSKSWGKRHSSASDKSRGKHTKQRKKRRSGRRSSSSSAGDHEETRHKEMFEIKTDSENTDYPKEINELDKVLSMVVNSPGQGSPDYDLDKVTAAVVGSPVGVTDNPFHSTSATAAESAENGDVKYTKFDSTQRTLDEPNRVNKLEGDDFGHAECHSLSDNSDEIVEVFQTMSDNNVLTCAEIESKPSEEDRGAMHQLQKTRKTSRTSSSSSSSSDEFKQKMLPQTDLRPPTTAAEPAQKFQLAATVMLDPRQAVEEGTVTYFGPVFLSPRKSEDGKNIQIDVVPGRGKVLRSPTPSEEEKIGAGLTSNIPYIDAEAVRRDKEGLTATHIGTTTSSGATTHSTLPGLPYTSLCQVVAGQIQPVGKEEEGEDGGANVEKKPETCEPAIRTGVESSLVEHSVPQISSNDLGQSNAFVLERPVPKKREGPVCVSPAEKDGDVENSSSSSSSSSSSESDKEEKIDHKVKGDAHKARSVENDTPPVTGDTIGPRAGGAGISVHISPDAIQEPEVQKYVVKTPDSDQRVLDLSQAVKIPLTSVGCLQIEGVEFQNTDETLDFIDSVKAPAEEPDAHFQSEQIQQSDVIKDTLVCVQSFAPQVHATSPNIEFISEEHLKPEWNDIESTQKTEQKLEQQTPYSSDEGQQNISASGTPTQTDTKKPEVAEVHLFQDDETQSPVAESVDFSANTGVNMAVAVQTKDEFEGLLNQSTPAVEIVCKGEEAFDSNIEKASHSNSDTHNTSCSSDTSSSSTSTTDDVSYDVNLDKPEESSRDQNGIICQSALDSEKLDTEGTAEITNNHIAQDVKEETGRSDVPVVIDEQATVAGNVGKYDVNVEKEDGKEKANTSVSSSSSSSSSHEGSNKAESKSANDSPIVDVCVCRSDQTEPCKNDSWEAVEEAFDNAAELTRTNEDKSPHSSHEDVSTMKNKPHVLDNSVTSNTSTSDETHSTATSNDKSQQHISAPLAEQEVLTHVENFEHLKECIPTESFTKEEAKTDSTSQIADSLAANVQSPQEPSIEVTCEKNDKKCEERAFEERSVDGYLPEQSDKMVLEESVSPFQPLPVDLSSNAKLQINNTPSGETAVPMKSHDKEDKKNEKKRGKKEKEEKKMKPPKKRNEKIKDHNFKEQMDDSKTNEVKKQESDTQGKSDRSADTSTSTTSSGDSSSSRRKSASKLFTWPFRKHKKKDKDSDTSSPEKENVNTKNETSEEYPETSEVGEKSFHEDVKPRTSTPLITSSDAETSECPSPKAQTRSLPSESDQSSKRQSPSRKSSSSSSSSEEATPHASRTHSPAGREHDTTYDTSEGQMSHQTSVLSSLAPGAVDENVSLDGKQTKKRKSSSSSSHTNGPENVTNEDLATPLRFTSRSSVPDNGESTRQKQPKSRGKRTKKHKSRDSSTASEAHTSQLDSSIASDAHSQQLKEKTKRKPNSDKKKKKHSEEQKTEKNERRPENDKEQQKDDLPKKRRDKIEKNKSEGKEKLREKDKPKDATAKQKPSPVKEKPLKENEKLDLSKGPSVEDKASKLKRKRSKDTDQDKGLEHQANPVLKEDKIKPVKQKPIEKPARQKRHKSNKSSEEPQTTKHQHPEPAEEKQDKHSGDSSSSSSSSDEEIDKTKIREALTEPIKESAPLNEKPLRSEAIEMTSKPQPIKSPIHTEPDLEVHRPQTQSSANREAEPVRPPRTPKSQKSGKFHKLLPSLRSPSAKDADKKFDKFADGPPKFDGQYHREDDVTHDDCEDTPKTEVYTSSPRQDEPDYSEPRHFVVVAIDFGTTHSGYAFSFIRDPSSVYMMRRWAGEEPGVVNQKTLTSLLLTPEGEFHSFGYSARSNYLNLVPLEARHWLYFSTFKMELHHNSELNRDTQLVASNGVKFSALRVFAHSLNFFKSHALQQLSDQAGTELMDEDIRWVITVPAIWKPPAKQFMRQAAYEAGLASPSFPEQLLIALEPEAASIYCRRLRMHQLVPEQPIVRPLQSPRSASTEVVNQDLAVTDLTVGLNKSRSSSRANLDCPQDESIESQVQGSRYLIVDCGGGTVDITVHELDPSGHITELHRATGGPFGSIGIDTEFERLLCGIFGIEFVEHYKRKYPMGWVHLTTDFESRKRSASPFKSTSLNVSPPFTFINDFKKHKYDPEVAVKKYGDSEVEWSPQGMLRLTPAAMKRLFLPTVTHIKQAVGDVLNHPNARGLKYLFLVGGFAESPILQYEMRQEFGHLIKLLIPQEVSLAILKGAVLFGVDPSIVNVRRSRLTYGVGILNRFDPKKHPASKRVRRDGVDWCTDILDKYVETDQPVMLGNSVVRSYTPAKTGQLSIVLNVYCSHNPNVRFITDPGVTRCGTLCLTLPVLDLDVGGGEATGGHGTRQAPPPPREIQARMSFGDTEINVVAIDMVTGKLVKASIDFLGR
ncbi:heat shock 70 kDa protein 12A [Elysia marginata]|uniref:Heat shock 70 kDa protein 12A n=1 Tax=Elysia marginata TaxID=1093978 RepID=A0AAV4FF64_9GAST|nr:heat shock 70 kDa protein 12A [Elysia marginata]